VRLSLTGFVNRLKDAIANVTLGQGPGVFPGVGFVAAGGTFRQRQNVDAVKVRGIEASAEWTQRAVVGARRREPDPCADGGERRRGVPRRLRPAQTPNFAGRWRPAGSGTARARSSCCAASARNLRTTSTRARLKGATTLDAYASWPLTLSETASCSSSRAARTHQQAGDGRDRRRRLDRARDAAHPVDRGRAYDPKTGKSYKAKLRPNPDGTLTVTGCVLFICQSQTWRRN
jgi:vitamin B12 transporter